MKFRTIRAFFVVFTLFTYLVSQPQLSFADDFSTKQLCLQTGELQTTCESKCSDEGSVWTAVGCISTTPEGITKGFVELAVGISGGCALALILWGSFLLSTSASNPERLKSGQEMVNSAIVGLVSILFSVIILQIIGVDILRIPTFGS